MNDIGFAVFLDGKVRMWTVRSRRYQCQTDYVRNVGRSWKDLMAAGFRIRKVRVRAI